MKVVIDIDKKIYQQAILLQSRGEGSVYAQIIANGTPLPEGHDRLVEARAVIKALFDKQTIDDVPTIIEADKESKDFYTKLVNDD